MGSFEQQPFSRENTPLQELVDLSSPKVQKALMELWAQESEAKFADHNGLGMSWIAQGFAEKFGLYRETHEGDTVDIHDEDSLRTILLKLGYSKVIH